jgi:LysM repeat protein
MKNLDLISEELFNKIRGRFPSVTIGNVDGKVTNVPKDARYFDFDYKEGDTSLGKVSVSVTDESIEVMYSDNFVGEQDELTQQNWYDFLKELRQFSKKRLMKFDTRNINKSNLDRRDYEFLAANRGDNTMSESKMYGTNKLSYQNVDSARIVIKHTESVNPELGKTRTRNIGKIYIESADGERFLYPYKHLTGARAMARHVAEGGKPFDDFGTHIVGLSEEMNKLRKFKSYMGRSAVMAESLAGYMDVVKERITTVRKTIESLQKPKFYAETIAAYEKPMMEDVPSDVAENWIDQLTIRQFNEELKDVFPYIYNLVSEATKAKGIAAEDILGEAPIDDVEVGAPAETYKVASGDTLYSIAKKFQNANFHGADIEEAVKEIMMLNNIADPKALQVGQVIEMPYFMGTGPEGSTRGMPGSFDKYGEEIEGAFESMMGQFAEAKEEFKPHMMYDPKTGKGKMANKEQDHKDLAKKGWTHDKPKDVKEAKKNCGCGQDPCITYGESDEETDEGNAYAHAVKKAKMNGKKKGDKIDGPDGDEITLEKDQQIPVTEFVLSLFDREQGTFPKGETAVLTAIEKDYGEQYIEPAKQFIERIQSTYEQYANPVQEPMIDEEPEGTVMEPTIEQDEEIGEGSGLQYHTGVKKHGKEYMVKAAQAGRDGASQEELGRLKDKYSKAEKNKTTKEAQDIMRLAGL